MRTQLPACTPWRPATVLGTRASNDGGALDRTGHDAAPAYLHPLQDERFEALERKLRTRVGDARGVLSALQRGEGRADPASLLSDYSDVFRLAEA
jgi:hypothetical protein